MLSDDLSTKKPSSGNMIKVVVIAIAVSGFLGGYIAGTMQNPNTQDNNVSEKLDQIISKIDKVQPQVIQQPNPQPTIIQQISLDDDPWIGNKDAQITIVEFSDFQCPFCSRFFHDTLSQIKQNYVESGKVKFVFRDLPLESIHPNALSAHVAAECADAQNKFWDYHDVLFERQAEWQRLANTEINSKLISYADELGLDNSKFASCMSDQSVLDEVRKDTMDAAKYGATGTPTFFIGNEKDGFTKLVGAQPFGSFQVTIDQKLG
jgi:protein-disulfide isomerase